MDLFTSKYRDLTQAWIVVAAFLLACSGVKKNEAPNNSNDAIPSENTNNASNNDQGGKKTDDTNPKLGLALHSVFSFKSGSFEVQLVRQTLAMASLPQSSLYAEGVKDLATALGQSTDALSLGIAAEWQPDETKKSDVGTTQLASFTRQSDLVLGLTQESETKTTSRDQFCVFIQSEESKIPGDYSLGNQRLVPPSRWVVLQEPLDGKDFEPAKDLLRTDISMTTDSPGKIQLWELESKNGESTIKKPTCEFILQGQDKGQPRTAFVIDSENHQVDLASKDNKDSFSKLKPGSYDIYVGCYGIDNQYELPSKKVIALSLSSYFHSQGKLVLKGGIPTDQHKNVCPAGADCPNPTE